MRERSVTGHDPSGVPASVAHILKMALIFLSRPSGNCQRILARLCKSSHDDSFSFGRTSVYFHFNDDLGTVVTTPVRTLSGPRGTPLASLPSLAIDVPVFNQDSEATMIAAVQPLTAPLMVCQGVKAAVAG